MIWIIGDYRTYRPFARLVIIGKQALRLLLVLSADERSWKASRKAEVLLTTVRLIAIVGVREPKLELNRVVRLMKMDFEHAGFAG